VSIASAAGTMRLFAALVVLVAAIACSSTAGSPRATSAPPPAAGAPAAPAASTAATEPPAVKLRVPYVAISVTQLPAWVAQDAGTFAKNGLDVALEYIPTGSTLIQTIVAGEADFGIAGSEAPISASLGGAEMLILAPTVDRLLFTIYARPEITDGAAMRGRRLGITRVGSSTDFAARQWIQSLGLRPGDDVPIVQLGGQTEMLAGLQSGAVDASVLSAPTDIQARRAGFRDLADLSRLDFPFYQSSVIATRRVVNDRPDVVRRFMRAIVEANAIIHQDKAAAKQALAHYSQSTDDEVLEASYEAALPAIPRVPLPTRAAVESAIELVALTNPAATGADPARFFDARFVQELDDSGFIKSLYR
jgi:ABC-type nitrate/sulfonate/bicarbonate transport system substrate-binding protein